MRTVVLCGLLAPFIWFAWKDNLFHQRGRKVPRVENLVHAGLGAALLVLVIGAFRGDLKLLFCGLGGVAALGAIDELGYHRKIPSDEHDYHAKEHFTLLVFVSAAFALVWLGK